MLDFLSATPDPRTKIPLNCSLALSLMPITIHGVVTLAWCAKSRIHRHQERKPSFLILSNLAPDIEVQDTLSTVNGGLILGSTRLSFNPETGNERALLGSTTRSASSSSSICLDMSMHSFLPVFGPGESCPKHFRRTK